MFIMVIMKIIHKLGSLNLNKIKKIIFYYKKYKKSFSTDLILSVFSSLIVMFIPVICHYITDNAMNMEKSDAIKNIICSTAFIIFLLVIFYLCKRYTEYNGNIFATKIERDIQKELFAHFQNQDLEFYNEQKVGKLMSSITNDAYNLTNIIKSVPEIMLNSLIRFIGVFTFLFFKNKLFALTLLILFILIFVFMCYFLPRVQKSNKNSREIFSDLSSDLEENLAGMKSIKSFVNEKISINKFVKNIEEYLKSKNKTYKIQSVFSAGLLSFVISWSPIITAIGAIFVLSGSITISDIITFILCVSVLESPLWDFVGLNEFLKDGIVGLERINNILELNPKIRDSKNALNLKIYGIIEFKNVSFKYNRMHENVLERLNLKIEKGEYIALVGPSGAGKSTICSLIPRFYDVSDGEILIDNINIKDIKLKSLRQNIGFVHQDTFLFSGTIKENICFGRIDAGDEEIVEAAKNAYAHDFIMKLPDGYNTQIGYRGLKLSGGQKQRLAIAQVFLKNPPILIFDEATSSLDNESEKFIQKSMEKLSRDRTTIVIAHRLSTIRNAKRILVLSNGKIVEEGTHVELLSKNGIYHEFYNLL